MVNRLSKQAFAEEIRTRLWPLPVAALVASVSLGILLPRVDAAIDDDLSPTVTAYLFGGGAGAAQTVLNAIATSLITVTSLTFSLTVLTLQLASSQYSPRLLRTFAGDRFVQRTLALFLGSFVYALTVLRTVRTDEGGEATFVPQLSVTVAFALTVACALGLVLFLAHLARQIRIETVLRNVHNDTTATIARVLADRETVAHAAPAEAASDNPSRPLCAPRSGFAVAIVPGPLKEAALRIDAVVAIDKAVGDALIEGTPVARAWARRGGTLHEDDLSSLHEALGQTLEIGFERTSRHDVGFGLRQLTDVAVKALSPGINDPTTAVHALQHSAALLCDLVHRNLNAGVARDHGGEVRVIVRQRSFSELLDLAVGQPRIYGAGDPGVLRALLELLMAVAWSATRQDQTDAVARQLEPLRRVIERGGLDDTDLEDLRSLLRELDDKLQR